MKRVFIFMRRPHSESMCWILKGAALDIEHYNTNVTSH